MRIFLVAGESSGDMHGAALVRSLLTLRPGAVCEGLGGHRMEAAGMALRHDLAGRAIMGFTEVVRSLGYIRRLFHDTVARLEQERPDCLVLIDYPGFNIRLAERAKAMGIRVVWYISPQIWAWKRGRIRTLARCVDKMLVILPFEKALYDAADLDCSDVGHPLLDHIDPSRVEGRHKGDRPVVGLLPGSREQEIRRHMAVMNGVARGILDKHPETRFVAPCVDEERASQIRDAADGLPVETDVGGMYEVLAAARFCLVASGTATLETALFGVPMAIVYRVSPLSYLLARMLVRIRFIGLVNILSGRGVVPEFIQHDAVPEKILPVALELMDDTDTRRRMIEDLNGIRGMLGGPGASERAAREVIAVAERN
jgi:lipid-A-disaccharide synthase